MYSEERSVIAISRDLMVVESLGEEVFPSSDLPKILPACPSSIIAVQGFGSHLQRLQRTYGDDPEFNYRVTPLKRYTRPWDDGRRLQQGMIVDAVCNFVGWKSDRKKRTGSRYHYPLDPLWFLTTGIDELDDGDDVRIVKLYRWAKEVRDWCQENKLQVRASAGGIAAQLLRDSRFYPEPRRKVPRSVNSIARYRLPGNYYHLRATTGKRYRALHVDMMNAHHFAARLIKFPDANTLHAYGDMSWQAQEDQRSPRAFAHGESPILKQPGLFHVQLEVPTVPREHFPPPCMETAGIRDVWLYSNELDFVKLLGGVIRKVYACYTSQDTEPGLNKYARFAIDQIREHPEMKSWLKPTLHCAYGLLAARATPFETGFWQAKGGDRVSYPMGNVSILATARARDAEIESGIVNVIHRGMIEAEVRKEALSFARLMTESRFNVLAIYADAVLLARRDDSGEAALPLLPPPWRLKDELTNLRFRNATTFTSTQLSRLPGVPRNSREKFLAQKHLARDLRKMRERKFADKRSTGTPC